ncbi:hypothetical protein DFR87_03160 [Metallosphaera hakonensis JCM 8857 = DSM 7519]|uniref:Uncharacterized protein n=1 Tax=Metallosphaera hakonensis JCM 8857 = DSM 7519 TaxID=1293036 RepID=A0A2U9IS91_9CREN|nr:hypothetical protein DFR87_03160 [Metallosphaera hakonensis JCM 8857 = DSM 7519]
MAQFHFSFNFERQYIIVIVQIIYKTFTPEIKKIIRRVRRIRSVEEVLFSKGDRNMIVADGLVAWEEGQGDPIEGIYDIKIMKSLLEITPQISG